VSEVPSYSRLASVYDEIVVDPCYDRWATFLHGLWQSDPRGVNAVLDVCCGTGLMARQLVSRGYGVVGVDSSPAMLARARELLGPEAVLIQQTLPDLTLDGTFDAAISTFDGFNYLTPTDLHGTLAAVARRLRGGGSLIFDLLTDAMMHFAVVNPVVQGSADGYDYCIVNSVDPRARTCDTTINVTRIADGDAFTEHHRQHFFTDLQVETALADAHCEVVAVTDEYSDKIIDAASLRATWSARRIDRHTTS
jgi:SAM-dependent methyltransferase